VALAEAVRADSPSLMPLACTACGWQPAPDAAYPYSCANAGSDDADHLIRHRPPRGASLGDGSDRHPFVRWRRMLYAWQAARARAIDDAAFVAQVHRLDAAIAAVDGHGFAPTPTLNPAALSERLGLEVWVKDETGQVAGSHKARHLMGLLLHLAVVEAGRATLPPLAIASCGNAALAAAVLARAAARALQVFVPPDAEGAVVERLRELGADVVACPREGEVSGDPCIRGLRDALARGALPFCCQGNFNGLTIDGGQTLVLEMLSQTMPAPDHWVVQVGGGALASACVQGLDCAVADGLLARLPRIHAVQTQGAAPLARAWSRVRQRALDAGCSVDAALDHALRHRSSYMWPWEEPPHSIASGIVDDETYDWMAVLRGVAASGGSTVVVDEDTLEAANVLMRETTDLWPSHTGSAGLAGVLALQRQGVIGRGERVAVLATGVQR
jgi:threonine synthase